MRVGIFYLSLSNPTNDPRRQPIRVGDQTVFVRVEETTGDLEDGLQVADPADDEAVMNTHPLDQGEWDKSTD